MVTRLMINILKLHAQTQSKMIKLSILFDSDQQSNLRPLAWQSGLLTTRLSAHSHIHIFYVCVQSDVKYFFINKQIILKLISASKLLKIVSVT